MGIMDRLFGGPKPEAAITRVEPFAMLDGGVLIQSPQQLQDYIAGGSASITGVQVNANSAMKVAAVFACIRIISGSVATLPLDIKRRVDDRTREDASDTKLWRLMRRRPNRWQKPNQFKRMMQAHVLLRGNAYAYRVDDALTGDPIELIPMHPDRVKPRQRPDLSMEYEYTRPNGTRVVFQQRQVLHLFGLSLDGITGVTPLTYAREAVGLSLAMEHHGAKTFRNGTIVGHVLKHPAKLGKDGQSNLRASLESYRSGGDNEGRDLILEEGMSVERLGMTLADASWIESRKLSRTDIFMFFGLPPHMAGDTEKSTSWGTGIEQQKQGYVSFTLEDHLVMWEEAITIDLSDDVRIYARFNRNAFVRGDLKARWDAYVKALQWGVYSPDDVLAMEDENPRSDGNGGQYYDPPNTAGKSAGDKDEETGDDPSQTA
jgi:HK97 family phage portal protein